MKLKKKASLSNGRFQGILDDDIFSAQPRIFFSSGLFIAIQRHCEKGLSLSFVVRLVEYVLMQAK